MSPTTILAQALWGKIGEQIQLTERLMTRIPADKLEWRPLPDAFRVGDLLGHLLETLAGFCAALYKLYPHQLNHFSQLRDQQVNHLCGVEEASERLGEYQKHLKEGFALLTDEDLKRPLATLFLPEGESALMILLGNLEHLINHKYQLFFYLRLLGVPVKTPELYQFRGPQNPK
jgi:uncharacterized damage-inducible protein DinB